jgi:hypothetical protein
MEFKNALKENQCIISGSFVLQCILDEHWEYSDIDIYFPTNSSNISLHEFLITDLYQSSSSGEYEYIDQRIKSVMNYSKQNYPKIQLVEIYDEDRMLHKQLNEISDFSVCKNVYFYDGKDNLVLSNLTGIFNKTTDFVCKGGLKDSIERYHKYRKRGFTFSNKNSLTCKDLLHLDSRISIRLNRDRSEEIIKLLGYNNLDEVEHVGKYAITESSCINEKYPQYFVGDEICCAGHVS